VNRSGASAAIAFDSASAATGNLTLHIQNEETTFASANVHSKIYIGTEGKISTVTVNAPAGAPAANPSFHEPVTVGKNSWLKVSAGSLETSFRLGFYNSAIINIESPTLGGDSSSGVHQGQTIVEGAAGTSSVDIHSSTLRLHVANSADTADYAGYITGEDGAMLEKSGAGTQILSGHSSYTGSINVSGGTLKITKALGEVFYNETGEYGGGLFTSSNAILHLDQTVDQIYHGHTQNTAIQGEIKISGDRTFTLAGSLEGASSGKLAVEGATFVLDNSGGSNNGVVNLAQTGFGAGTTLAGNGRIAGAVSFGGNATISPGKSGGTDGAYYGAIQFDNASNGITYDHITYKIKVAHDLNGNTQSTRLSHTGTGAVVFTGNNTIDIDGSWDLSKHLHYTILTAEGGVGSGGTDYADTTFLESGAAPDPHHFYSLSTADENKSLVLNAINAYYALYWGAEKVEQPYLWENVQMGPTPKNFYRAANLADAGTPIQTDPDYTFANGDIVIFADTYKDKIGEISAPGTTTTITVAINGVAPNTLVVSGEGTNITFQGNPITIQPHNLEGADYFDEYDGIENVPSALFVQNGAVVRFENTVTSGANNQGTRGKDILYIRTGAKVYVSANGTVQIPQTDLGTGENPGTLEFNKNQNDENLSYAGVISGDGHLILSGDGTQTFTLRGGQRYKGNTTVTGGILKIEGGLGAVFEEGTSNLDSYSYAGKIELTKADGINASGIEFSTAYDFSQLWPKRQTLRGVITGDPGTELIISKGGAMEIASDKENAPHPHPNADYVAADHPHNAFKGNLTVKGDTELTISGRLNVVVETFDSGTPWGISYQHSQYGGDITIEGNSAVSFAYKGDYQLLSGNLTGAGGLYINTGMPFYFTGNAAEWRGKTTVDSNSRFHLNTSNIYGNGGFGSMFTVRNGSALYIGANGAKIYTERFEMEKNTRLVVNAKTFTIQTSMAERTTFGSGTEGNVTFVFRVSNEDFGNNPDPADAKLIFNTEDGNGVVLNAGQTLRLDVFGYIPLPSDHSNPSAFLMTGLNTNKMWETYRTSAYPSSSELFSEQREEELAKAIFSEANLATMKSFKFRFTINGELRIDLISAAGNVPEPAAYGLFSGIFIAGLAFLHRRRKKK
jgi:autotransporter-associated beta strand protein